MKYEAIVFDLDGTLIHTAPEYRYIIVGNTLKDLGVSASNKKIDKFWFEKERNKIIKNEFGVKEPQRFWEKYDIYEKTDLRKNFVKAYEDINFNKELKNRGYKLGIVTSAAEHIVDIELELIGKKYFDAVIMARSSNGIIPKPHPQGLLKCLDELKVNPEKSIYVGNAEEDLICAEKANVLGVIILRNEYKFKNINSCFTISSLDKLEKILSL